MASETTTAITAVKQDVRLREWAEQLDAQQASGLTVPQWCAENGIYTGKRDQLIEKIKGLEKPNPRRTRHMWSPEMVRQILHNYTYLRHLVRSVQQRSTIRIKKLSKTMKMI